MPWIHESFLSIFTIERCRFWCVFESFSLRQKSKQPHVKLLLIPTIVAACLAGYLPWTWPSQLSTWPWPCWWGRTLVGWLVGRGGELVSWSGGVAIRGGWGSSVLQALVLVPGTNLAFRQTAPNPDGSLALEGTELRMVGGVLLNGLCSYASNVVS